MTSEQATLEKVADVQHEIWSHWMKYLFTQCPDVGTGVPGTKYIPADKVERWSRQMETPYAELSEREKESDRDQAKKVLAVLDGLWPNNLSDAEVAFLAYACETESDRVHHNPYATDELVATAEKLDALFEEEYNKRNLNWTHAYKEGYA